MSELREALHTTYYILRKKSQVNHGCKKCPRRSLQLLPTPKEEDGCMGRDFYLHQCPTMNLYGGGQDQYFHCSPQNNIRIAQRGSRALDVHLNICSMSLAMFTVLIQKKEEREDAKAKKKKSKKKRGRKRKRNENFRGFFTVPSPTVRD